MEITHFRYRAIYISLGWSLKINLHAKIITLQQENRKGEHSLRKWLRNQVCVLLTCQDDNFYKRYIASGLCRNNPARRIEDRNRAISS
jgi:hypothetical protein